jgi:inosine/xanthosine triphosphatase
MQVAVGSTNPVKVAATGTALSNASVAATVEGVAVDSGVSDQPRSVTETARGARRRARRALDDADRGVGIEGGVADDGPIDGLALVMYAAATDGERTELAAGPRLRLPTGIARRVRDGEELGPGMDTALGPEGLKERAGAAGVLTGGATDRESALATAVAGALGPFLTERYE